MQSEDSLDPTTVRRRAALVILLSLLLHAPSLGWGYFADDHVHKLVLDGELREEGYVPWALYEFGVLADRPELRDVEGTFPFWTGDDWKAQFFRPLSSVVRWGEHVVSGGSAVVVHAFGLAWWGLFLLLAWRLYAALGLAPRAALWALTILAVENGNGMTVGWSANRNSIVEGVLVLGAVLAFVEGTRTGSRARLAIAFACAVLALGAKESGVAGAALLAGWAWSGRRATRTLAFERGRVRWAALAAVLATGFVVAYVAAGYGTRSLFYPTPWGEPLAWLERLAVTLPGGVVAMTTPLATDAVHVVEGITVPTVTLGILLALWLAKRLGPSATAHPAGPFLVAWILVTLLPQAGAPLSDRLFLLPLVGAAALLGIFLEATRLRMRAGWAGRAERVTRTGLIVSCVVLSAVGLFAFEWTMLRTAAFSRAAITTAEVGPVAAVRRDVFVLQSPSQLVSLQPTAVHASLTGDEELRYRVLNATRRGVRWTRTGERSFRLESLDDPFLTTIFERVYLTRELELEPGHLWSVGDLTVRVVTTEDGLPRTLEFVLDRSLDDERIRFLAWDASVENPVAHGKWVHVPVPEVGATVTIETARAPLPLLP